MEKLKAFFVTTLIGGVAIILPIALLMAVFGWIFNFVLKLIAPMTNILTNHVEMRVYLAVVIVLVIIIVTCFLVGLLVRTRFGGFFHRSIENGILKNIPGYNLIKETVLQFLGNKKSPFSSVALANVYENHTLVTCFVTDEHPDGTYTVFVPTGPNPTSGNIFHLKKKYVHILDVSVEDTMRSIISCGAGSSKLMEELNRKK